MGWYNPPVPWTEYERRLSGRVERPRPAPPAPPVAGSRPAPATPPVEDSLAVDEADRRERPAPRPPTPRYQPAELPYAELHCHSNYSFLDGASHPEELVDEAVRLGLHGLALTDHDGFHGVVKFAVRAQECGLPTIFGAELTLDLAAPPAGEPDPGGRHLVVLARGQQGYHRLSAAISAAHLAGGTKGRPKYDWAELADAAGGHWQVLTGCRKGTVPAALATGGTEAAADELARLVEAFGADRVAVELTDHDQPDDDERNDALAALAHRFRLPVVATNNVHYAHPRRRRIAAALAAIRSRRSLDDLEGWLPAAGSAHLRTAEEVVRRFAAYPDAVASTVELARACAFPLQLIAPRLPDYSPDPTLSEMDYLRNLTAEGALSRYGPAERAGAQYEQLDHELGIIGQLNFPGYFLVVHDIVRFCAANGILCQGRGSAANSAVCYALGITNADPIAAGLLFERFLAPERDGPPDIDVDIEAGRREEVIQYVYTKHGRERAAQVANVISYRPRMAVRDAARALGFSPGQQDAWSKQIERWGPEVSGADTDGLPAPVAALADELLGFPRHLGIHSGGMVICDVPVSQVCPVEHARMPNRTVVQWDKDDCASAGLVKFDLLGLGMLGALHTVFDLVAEHHGQRLGLHTVPTDDDRVYDMLCDADSVGVFQVESRAQMATLPRLRPRCFYDLVVEVALIRPGPIQGGSVHPYIRRKRGREPATVPHPKLARALSRTLGVPLFQEQLMQMAIDVAGFDPSEADRLRRAMGSKRSMALMAELRERLYAGMAGNGITGELADSIYDKLSAFANFGFPESHAISFAHLVYVSAWLKRYHPAAFTTGLLANQPMGFYSPHSLIADARRHGVPIRGVDVNASAARAALEPLTPAERAAYAPRHEHASPHPQPAVRLGLATVRHLGTAAAERVVAERESAGPYADLGDFAHRTGLPAPALEALATGGAFGCFGLSRRAALWSVGAVAGAHPGQLPATAPVGRIPALPAMTPVEQTIADLWATGSSPSSHPMQHVRSRLDESGVTPADRLGELRDRGPVRVAGLVTHRQRPGTAGGVVFLSLEDETGIANIVCPPQVWQRYRRVGVNSAALLVHGVLESTDGVTNVLAARLTPLQVGGRVPARDFH
jgi:error-prone DNA polymerase